MSVSAKGISALKYVQYIVYIYRRPNGGNKTILNERAVCARATYTCLGKCIRLHACLLLQLTCPSVNYHKRKRIRKYIHKLSVGMPAASQAIFYDLQLRRGSGC